MIRFLIALSGLSLLIFAALIYYIETLPPCLEWKTETVVTFPNIGLTALGPAYTGVAMIPILQEMKTCVRRADQHGS